MEIFYIISLYITAMNDTKLKFLVSEIRATEGSKDKAMVEFVLMHSYPAVNGNGVALMPKTLANSIQSLVNSPLDIDHEMEGVWFWEDGDPNKVIGSITEARLNPEYQEGYVPENGYEVIVKAVIWKRLKDVKAIIQDVQDNAQEWKASFEIAPYSVKDQIFYYHKGKMYSEQEANQDMRLSWEWGEPYEGEMVSLCFGGEDGQLDFYGAALTLTPADENTRILNLVANKKGRTMEFEKLVKEFRSVLAEEEKKYEGWVSPEDLAKAVAVAKAEAEAKYEGYISPEMLATKISEAQESVRSGLSQQYETFIARLDSIREKGVELDSERRKFTFEASDEDFAASLVKWSQALDEMITELEKNGVEVTVDLKENIAKWEGKEDERLVALVSALKSRTGTIPPAQSRKKMVF